MMHAPTTPARRDVAIMREALAFYRDFYVEALDNAWTGPITASIIRPRLARINAELARLTPQWEIG